MAFVAFLLLGTSSASANSNQDHLSKVGSPAAQAATSQSHVSAKINRMQRHTNMWRAMASKYAGKLGYTLSWHPLSDFYGKLKRQEHAARYGCRYWHHRYHRIHKLAHDTAHLRIQTQRYAHWTHPHRQFSWAWTSLSFHPAVAHKQHRSAAGADLFWLHQLRHIARPTATQVVHMICSYQDWGCDYPVSVASCESGLRYWATNPSNPDVLGIFQMGTTARSRGHVTQPFNGGQNIRGAHIVWHEDGNTFSQEWACA